jgi:hypothetical protein
MTRERRNKGDAIVNVALIYKGEIISVAAVKTLIEIRRRKELWAKLYGPKFKECETQVNFNQ